MFKPGDQIIRFKTGELQGDQTAVPGVVIYRERIYDQFKTSNLYQVWIENKIVFLYESEFISLEKYLERRDLQ